eukprot:sb/3478069/
MTARLTPKATITSTAPSEGTVNFEEKIQDLTEVLLAKQSEVERLNSERGSLVVRMEGLESLLQSAERKSATANSSVAIPMPNNNLNKVDQSAVFELHSFDTMK